MRGEKLICERCDNDWIQRYDKEPKTCPGCKSPFWKKPLDPYWKAVKERRLKGG